MRIAAMFRKLMRFGRSSNVEDVIHDENGNPTRLENDNLSLTLWGLPTDINPSQHEEIFDAVAQHSARKFADRSFSSGDVIDTHEFTVKIEEKLYRVRYELKALRFLAALETFRDAIQWIHQQPNMDNEVAHITEAHLLRELRNEYESTFGPIVSRKLTIRGNSASPIIIEPPVSKDDTKPSSSIRELGDKKDDKR